MHVTLRQLRVFVVVARHGSFSLAARWLHLSQPAVSRLVRELETVLGLSLFDRSTRAVQLTPAGRLLHSRAHTLLQMVDATVAEVVTACVPSPATVRLVVPSSRHATRLAAGLAWCQRRYPAIAVIVHQPAAAALGHALVQSAQADFGMAALPPAGPQWHCECVAEEDLRLVSLARSPWRARPAVAWTELGEHHLVLLAGEPEVRDYVLQQLDAQAVRVAAIRVAPSLVQACRWVAQGRGVGVWPAGLGVENHEPWLTRPMQPPARLRLQLWRWAARPLAPAAQLIWSALAIYLALASAAADAPPARGG